jgi:hypothetical protein
MEYEKKLIYSSMQSKICTVLELCQKILSAVNEHMNGKECNIETDEFGNPLHFKQ